MRSIIGAVAAAACLGAPAFGEDWQLDPAHTSAQFSVRHMMVSNVHGMFGKVTGAIHEDEKDITKSTVEATIDATSIDTREPKRDADLKSEHFLEVAKYPNLTFRSTQVSKAGKDKLKVDGELTIHGVTKPVVLAVELAPKAFKDPFQGAEHRGATATTTINRKDFGLTWNKPLEAGGFLVGDEVKIELDVEMVKAAPVKGS